MRTGTQRGMVMASTTVALLLGLASTAVACVTFMGKVEVTGHDGKTEVVGTGNSHAYCSDGRPTTAAAGHLEDQITITTQQGNCADADAGAAGAHQLPEGTYEVRFNNDSTSYIFDGTHWNMKPGAGCFRSVNAATSTILEGPLTVDASGNGSWTGTLGVLKQDPAFATPLTASNLCIGAPTLPPVNGIIPGMLAPYQLLAI